MLFGERFKTVFDDKPTLWINVARVSAIIAGTGILFSPTVASVALVTAYLAFVASGQAVVRIMQVFHRPAVYLGVVFLGVVVIGMTYASVPWSDRWIDLFKWRTMLWFFVLLSIFDDERWKTRLLVTFVVGTAVALVASFVTATGWITLWRNPEAFLRNAATQGMAFSIAILICLWMVLEKRAQGKWRWGWMVLGALYLSNVVFITHGRSGYVVLGFGLSVLLMWQASPVQRLIVAAVVPMVAALAFFVSPRMHDRIMIGIDQWVHAAESSVYTPMGVRRVFHEHSLEIAADHWLIGVGTGEFRHAYAEHVALRYQPSNWRFDSTGDPHNQYLAVLVQHGIGGLAVFLVWIVGIARDKAGLPTYRKLALAILCGWCVTSLFSSHFRTFTEGHLLMTFLGALLSATPHQDQAEVARKTLAQPSS